jgi:mannonate dehydratase
MGVTHCFTWVEEAEHETEAHLAKLVARCRLQGLVLNNVGCRRLGKNADIILGNDTDGRREAALSELCEFIGRLGRAGISVTTFTWEPDGVWSVSKALTRGATEARFMDTRLLESLEPRHGREFDEAEMWANMEHMLARTLPAAKAAGVKLALHPNDPPVHHKVCGVPVLMRDCDAFRKAFALSDALGLGKWLGMEFCCGCALEGGSAFGSIMEELAGFVEAGRVLIVHLRNVSSPMPEFVETFLDGGYGDVYGLLRTLARGGYGGTVILDHTPPFVPEAGPAAASAFAVGYMKAGIRAAQAEMALAGAASGTAAAAASSSTTASSSTASA